MRIKKHLSEKKSLICVFVFFVLFVRAKSFCKKIKEFKTALITSFILLLPTSLNFAWSIPEYFFSDAKLYSKIRVVSSSMSKANGKF